MPAYSAFGLTIESEIEIGHLPLAPPGPVDVVIRYGDIVDPPFKTALADDLVRIGQVAQFRIRNGNEIVVRVTGEVPEGLVPVLLSGRLMAYLLRQRGWLPLHASAVQVGDSAVLFMGAVGSGKSTTAAAFHARGCWALTDDVAPVQLVEGTLVLCNGPARLRLCDDAASAFQTLDPDAHQVFDKKNLNLTRHPRNGHSPVAAIYLLGEGSAVRTEAVASMEALSVIGRECFIRLRYADAAVLKAHLRDCASVTGAVPVRRIFKPRDLSQTARIVEAVLAEVGTLGVPSGGKS